MTLRFDGSHIFFCFPSRNDRRYLPLVGRATLSGLLVADRALEAAAASSFFIHVAVSVHYSVLIAVVLQNMSFRVIEPGTLKWSDVQHCGRPLEPQNMSAHQLPPEVKPLVIVGAQKSGTTWAWFYLCRHPNVMCATHIPNLRCDFVPCFADVSVCDVIDSEVLVIIPAL